MDPSEDHAAPGSAHQAPGASDPAFAESHGGLLRDRIIAAMRRAIELGALKAGDRLIEKDLCARFGVSRPPLREALRDLEANGVVRKISARTLIVTPLTREDVINISRVRTAIEMMLAEHFCRDATPAQIGALDEAMRAVEQADPIGGANLDATWHFYRCWCEGAGNPFAFDILMNIQLRLSVVRSRGLPVPEIRQMNLAYQRGTVGHLARRDTEAAVENVRRHNRDVVMALLDLAAPARTKPSRAAA